MKIWILLIATASIFIGCESKESYHLLDDGISIELANYRAKSISNVRYNLKCDIDKGADSDIFGSIDINFDMDSTLESGLIIDFREPQSSIMGVFSKGAPIEYRYQNSHIIISSNLLSLGENSVTVEFRVGDMSLNRTDDYLYTLFVPDRASTAVPCFDQPDLKAKVTLELKIPSDWEAVANGKEVSVKLAEDGDKIISFEETKPIPTYLLAFTAGDYKRSTKEIEGREMNFFYRESDEAKVARNIDRIFEIHGDALLWLEDYTDIDYPFGKFDFVAIPSFQYGGMEHPGCIWYKDRSLFLEDGATSSSVRYREQLISHETAHMWFGDLVTMEWFSEVWLKEVFANFMSDKIIQPIYPEIDFDLAFLMAHYPSAYGVDRTPGANAVTQVLPNLKDAGTLYGGIIYHKSPVVMKQLEKKIGKEILQDAIKIYLKEFSYSSGTWDSLIDIIANCVDQSSLGVTGDDIKQWSAVWIYEAGMPTIDMEVNNSSVSFSQADAAEKGRIWDQTLSPFVIFANDSSQLYRDVKFGEVLSFNQEPVMILPNGAGELYGFSKLNRESISWLLNNISSLESDVTRGSAWITLYENYLKGSIETREFIDAILKAIPLENSKLILAKLTGYLSSSFWSYLDNPNISDVAVLVDDMLTDEIKRREDSGIRRSLFKCWSSTVITKSGVDRLRAIWKGDLKVDGINLSENDMVSLSYELAVRLDSEAGVILGAQISEIKNVDLKRSAEFISKAISGSVEIRNDFFKSLKDPANREHEPWVATALRYLNHPLRVESSKWYIDDILKMGPEIQETGDIFFPTNWFNSGLGGFPQPLVRSKIEEFLKENPTYPEPLKLKMLQVLKR